MTTNEKRAILIVEDNVEHRHLYKKFLTLDDEYEYVFYEASNVEEGIKCCNTCILDCILLDIELSGFNGLDFLAQLSENFGKVFWPVIVITGHGSESTAVEAMKRGAQDYMIKAKISSVNLLRTIDNAIGNVAASRLAEKKYFELEKKTRELQLDKLDLESTIKKQNVELMDANQRLFKSVERPDSEKPQD